jgi:hypothetical protein
MRSLIELKKAAPVFFVALVCFGLLPTMQAVSPAPDGGYPGGNTAEGQAALLSLTTGQGNTAAGWLSLRSNTWHQVPNNPGDYIANNQPVVQTGRDIIDNGTTSKPGYTPFVYPHPLTTQCGGGVYSLTGEGRPVANGVLSNPNVDGVSIRLHWSDLETADHVYNWAYLDTQVSRVVAAGKSVSLRIGTAQGDATRGNGGNVPGWVIDEITASVGGTPNDCAHYFHFNNPPVANQAIPTFWQPIFVRKRRELLTALGAHFANNPNIKVVFVGVCNAKSSDWSVPDSTVVDNICGAGQSERSRWLGLGYTSQKLIDQACPASGTGGVIDAAALAFPDKFIAYAVGRNSGLDPTQDYVAEHITQNARAKYGNRILIAKESLSQKTYENDPYNQQPADNGWFIMWELPPCAAQMDSDVSSVRGLARMSGRRDGGPVQVLTDAVNVGADYGTVYQEIYQDDVTNPVTAPVIAYAHGLLARPCPTPTPTATPASPAVTTNPATNVASFSATLNGSLNPRGLTTTVDFQYGLTTSYGFTTTVQTQTGNTVRPISANISGLMASHVYHFRIVAHNGGGTSFGSDRTFTTLSATGPPVVATSPATLIASFSATLNGSLDPHGLTTTVHFQYGTTTSYGLTTAPQSHNGNTYLNISANISSLSANTIYHYRIVASNSAGTSLGSDRTFTTLAATGAPVVTTNPATNVTTSSATLNGSLDPHGLTTTVHFQYGTTTSYGLTTAPQSQTGNTYRNITANISGLTTDTTYHFRIVATNSGGTRYGGDRTFTTP